MRKRISRSILAILFALLCFEVQSQNKHLWNLQDADIHAVIAAVSKETNKNFIVDPRVQGKITIFSSKPIDAKAVYQVFLSALQILGYSAVPSGNFVKIVPDIDARSMAAPITDEQNPGQGDELVVRVVAIKYVSAIQLVPILRPLMPQWSNIEAYSPSNVIILAGRAANVNRMVKIINRVDLANTSEIEVIPLHFASASKIVSAIRSLQDADRTSGKISNIALAADDESNKILMSGNSADRLRMRVLISELDTASGANGNTQVVHLNYLNAKKLAPVLAAIAHSAYIDQTGKKGVTVGSDQQVAIKDDEDTNSIIISAPSNIMSTLLDVIHQLDTHPSQVLVEAVIAQVDESTSKQLGITWGTQQSSSLSDNDNEDDNDNNSGQLQPGVGIIKHGDIRILIHALQGNSSTDILSTPSIVVQNNQKAKIKVGKNVSIENREYAGSGTDNSLIPYTTFERKDVALVLEVTPHITPDKNISLKLDQTNDTLQDPINPGDNPIINTNQINTTVMVNNGAILVLGGLIEHDLTDSDSSIPILGKLPLIGPLFHSKHKQLEKKNLMIFIRPVVIQRGVNQKQITFSRYNYLRTQQLLKARGIDIITNVAVPPLLPPLKKPIPHLPNPFNNI